MQMKKLQERSEELSKLIVKIEKVMPQFPKGRLRIARKKQHVDYYYINGKYDNTGKYITKKEKKLPIQLAKKGYYQDVLNEAKREKRAIDNYIRDMKGTKPEDVYDNLSVYRKGMVDPIILSDTEYAKMWQAKEYQGNPYKPEEKIYDTKRGEKVRTKVEAWIADIYYELGIYYKYEYPFVLKDGSVRYPDFTLLKLPERKEVYHEHYGLFEDEEYRKKNLIKIQDYLQSGMNWCDNFFITYETEYIPFSVNETKKLIKRIFLDN